MNEHSKELMHMTDAEKADYNRQYYRKHKQYWVDYANTGHGIGRQSSPNTDSDALPHARKKETSKKPTTGGNKWGTGLGAGKVGPENSGFPRRPKSKEGVQAYNRAKMDIMTKGRHYGDSNREQKARVYKGIAEAQAGINQQKENLAKLSRGGKRVSAQKKQAEAALKKYEQQLNARQGDAAMIQAQSQMHSNSHSGSRTPASSVTKSKSRNMGSEFVKRRFGR